MEKLKRVVIKEELVALTGNFKKAIVLGQMIYWAERVKDADKFIQDEIKRSKMAIGKQEFEYAEKLEEVDLLSHGWIYKTATDLSEETMMGVSKSTMGTYLNELVEKGWLDKRKNPKWKGDNTFQYRVNLLKIQKDLQELGFSLEGYPLLVEYKNETTEFKNRTSEFENKTTSSILKQTVRESNHQFDSRTTLPEITSEITSEITLNNVCSEEKEILSLLETRSDINTHTNKQLINLLNAVKRIDSFQYSIFKETLNLVNFTLYDINYFKRSLNNNINKGYVHPAQDHINARSQQKEILPNWYDNKEKKKEVAAIKENNSEKTDEDYQQTKAEIERMLKQLKGQMA